MTSQSRRRIAWFLAITYIFSNQAPIFAASYFTRPGAGVSRMPLDVMAFNAPGFGQVEDAINLANGNVFMAVEGLSRNNKQDEKKDDEKTAESLDNNWSLSARLRLEGFRADLTEAPDGFALFSGDGSGTSFTKAQPDFTTAPSWIKRYQTIANNIAFYRAMPLPGTKYSADWVVLRLRGANRAIAHYYDASGTRSTFSRDGHYLDYAQNQSQQYRSAKDNNDVDGDANDSKRTEITYEPVSIQEVQQSRTQSGRIATVSDEYGRVTTYQWNNDGNPQTLDAINYFSDQTAGGLGHVRRTEFSYQMLSPSGIRVITEIRFKAQDGRGIEVTRKTKFSYVQIQPANQGYRTLIKTIERDVPNSGTSVTTYTYSSNGEQLDQVTESGKSVTTYRYLTSEFGGRLVEVKEAVANEPTKVMEYHYDTVGRLRKRTVADKSPVGGTDRTLTWKYGYVKSGALGYLEEPSGKSTHMFYDDRGNLIKQLTYTTPTLNPQADLDVAVEAKAPVTNLMAGQKVQMAAFVKNDPSNKGVSYLAAIGDIDSVGMYTAPAIIPGDMQETITIESRLDPSKRKQITLNLKATTVTGVNLPRALRGGDSVQLNAKVDFSPTDQSVTYTTSTGTVSTDGIYTAPAVIPMTGNVMVTATSKFDPSKSTQISVPVQAIEVKLATPATAIRATEPLQLSAKVLHDKTESGFVLSASMGTITAAGVYTAPAALSVPSIVTITATSVTDPSKSSSLDIQVVPLNVTAYVPLPDLNTTSNTQLAALLEDWLEGGVDWAASLGQILPTGQFTAPSDVDTDTPVTVTATSRTDPTKTGTITINVKPSLSVRVESPVVTLTSTQKANMSAWVLNDWTDRGVTWIASSGTITADGEFTAPSNITSVSSVTITAKSKANPNVTGSLEVLVYPLTVQVAMPVESVALGGSVALNAKVIGDLTQAGVDWSVNHGSINAQGVYLAPNIMPVSPVTVTATSKTNSSISSTITLNILPIEVQIASPVDTVALGASLQFSNRVGNDSVNQGVTWSSNFGSISPTGLLTVPSTVPGDTITPTTPNGTLTITATSKTNPSQSASVTVNLAPIIINLSTPNETVVYGSKTQLSARVTGDYLSRGVTWSVNQGSISATGLYTAPNSAVTSPTIVTATSVANPSKTAQLTLPLAPIGVQLNAPVTTAMTGEKVQFNSQVTNTATTAGVTYTATQGTITTSGLWTAPSAYSSTPIIVTATSVTDPSKKAEFTLNLALVSVSLATPNETITYGSKTQLTARVSGDYLSRGVTWTASQGSISATGLYTAPSNAVANPAVVITATSVADPSKNAQQTLTLAPVNVGLSAPVTTAMTGEKVQFNSYVTNAPAGAGVTYTTTRGVITATGLLTVPNTYSSTPMVVTATSQTDPTKKATWTINPIVVAINASVPTNNLSATGTMQVSTRIEGDALNQGVTWTLSPNIGTISATGLYTAPKVLSANTNITITAKSVADTTKTAAVTLSLRPLVTKFSVAASTLFSGQTLPLAARVEGDMGQQGVTYILSPNVGSISNGIYTAPKVSTDTTVTITARSVADTGKTATRSIIVKPLGVVVIAAPTNTLTAGARIRFTADVSNDLLFRGVTWTTTAGTIAADGTLTAPSTISSTTTITVTATSKADTSKTASTTITAIPISLNLVVPATSVASGRTLQFAARVVQRDTNTGVTWTTTAGTISNTGLFTPPTVTANTNVTIAATSTLNTAISQTQVITVTPTATSGTVTVNLVNPIGTEALYPGVTQQLAAFVGGNPTNKNITWSIVGTNFGATISNTGLFTTPKVASAIAIQIRATAAANTNVFATTTINVQPLNALLGIPLSVPTTQARLVVGQRLQLSALAMGDPTYQGVTWTTNAGNISTAGLFTAPATVNGAEQQVTITATSVRDNTKTINTTLFVTPSSLSISKASDDATLLSSAESLPISAFIENNGGNVGVTYSLSSGASTDANVVGTISTTGLYKAPNVISVSGVRITATAINGSASNFIDVGLQSTALAISDPIAITAGCCKIIKATQKVQLSAKSVNTSLESGVNWSVTDGTIDANGLFTAPNVSDYSSGWAGKYIVATATSKTDPSRIAQVEFFVSPVDVFISSSIPITGGCCRIIKATEKAQFSASVIGDTSNAGVTWSVSEGTIDANGLFTAPNVSDFSWGWMGKRFIATATSKTDVNRAVSIEFFVSPVDVSISSSIPITGGCCRIIKATEKAQFSASVIGDTSNAGVTWSVSEGTIDANGLFTAPNVSDFSWGWMGKRFIATATSKTDVNRAVSIEFFVSPVDVAISSSIPIIGGYYRIIKATEKAQFSASVLGDTSNAGVTWSVSEGTIDANGLFTAPNVSDFSWGWMGKRFVATATSKIDPSRIAQVEFFVSPVDVAISSSIPIIGGYYRIIKATEKAQFSASVLGDTSNAGVTWSVSEGTIDANGLFTAPNVSDFSWGWMGKRFVATATSKTDVNRAVSIEFFVSPLTTVTINNPLNIVYSTQKVALIARVPEDRTNAGVTWSTSAGSITQAGVFTAPTVTAPTPVIIMATSKTDPSQFVGITILVQPTQRVNTVVPVTEIAPGDSVQFSSKVYDLNARGDTGVTWSSSQGNVTADGLLTVPSLNPVGFAIDYPIYVTATAKAGNPSGNQDHTKLVTVRPVQVQISSSTSEIAAGSVTQLSAQTRFDLGQQGVTWNLDNSSLGSITENGVYTAPSSVSSDTTVVVRATSKADPSRFDTLNLTIPAPVVELANPTVETQLDSFMRFSANAKNDPSKAGVTWTASQGLMTADGRYLPPRFTNVTTVTITATSKTYPGVKASTSITLTPDTIAERSGWKQSVEYRYDNDNRRTIEFTPSINGTIADSKFDYQARRVSTTYTESSQTKDGQVFTLLTKVVRKNELGGTMPTDLSQPQTSGNGIEQYRNETTLDSQGRLEKTERIVANMPNRTTTYQYASAGATSTPTTLNEDTFVIGSAASSVKLYQDQVVGSTESSGLLSRKTKYEYDALGFTTLTRQENAFAGTSSTELQTRDTYSAYNGFGQMIWQWVGSQGGNAATVNANYYHPSGELSRKWEGNKENQTNYTYDTIGRVITIKHGIRGTDTTLATTREQLEYTYDGFGRIESQKVDSEFVTTMEYDTLDRIVETLQPSGVKVQTTYNKTGKPSQVKTTEGTLTITEKNTAIDSFGNVKQYEYADNQNLTTSAYTIETEYDVYDQPIQVTDSRLSAVLGGASQRTSYMVYDSYGRLIKQLEPALVDNGSQNNVLPSSNGQWYTDNHRPYTEMTYDALGRKVSESKLLRANTAISPSSLTTGLESNIPNPSNVATSQIMYDGFDRPIKSLDPEGYSTTLEYDSSDNPTKRSQEICKSGDAVCFTTNVSQVASTEMRYDATGKPVRVTDAKGNVQSMGYNTLGQPIYTSKTMTVDGSTRTVTSKLMGYTKDGLLEIEAEPDNNSSTSSNATALDPNNQIPGGFVATKKLEYGNRAYPIRQFTQAPNNTTATAPSNVTEFSNLDYAGRPTVTTLPTTASGAAAIERNYDARGNVTRLKDAEGFETRYAFDANNRLTEELKVARAGDAVAFPNGYNGGTGLKSEYTYDKMGNLYKRTEQGRTVYYAYNSLGKVIAESRPLKNLSAAPTYKISAYRLDGQKTLESTHDYIGTYRAASNPSGLVSGAVGETSNAQSRGGLNWQGFDARGLAVEKIEYQTQSIFMVQPGGGTVLVQRPSVLSQTQNTYNGLGLRIKRQFQGDTNTYVKPLKTDGSRAADAQTTSYWKYDSAGLLLRAWDQAGNETTDQNIFEYTYTATGKQASENRDVRVVMDGNTAPNNDAIMGASVATINNTYNERDQLAWAEVKERKLTGKNTISNNLETRTVTYNYNTDGSRTSEIVAGQGTRTFTYDARGREIQVTDSNGASIGNPNITGATTTTTTYSSDGSSSVRMVDGTGKCKSQTDTKPTIAGLTANRMEWTWEARPSDPALAPNYVEVVCGANSTANITDIDYNSDGTQQNAVSSSNVRPDYSNQQGEIAPIRIDNFDYFQTAGQWKSYQRYAFRQTANNQSAEDNYGNTTSQSQSINEQFNGINVDMRPSRCLQNSGENCVINGTWGPLTAEQNDFGYLVPAHSQGAVNVPDQFYPAGTAVPQVNGIQDTTVRWTTDNSGFPTNFVIPTVTTTQIINAPTPRAVANSNSTNTYNVNGDLITEDKSSVVYSIDPNYGPQTTNDNSIYSLDAFGRRLATTGGKYNQFSKRYNPDGQTAEFNRAPKGADGGTVWSIIFNRKSWFDTYILAFRYDPQGQQILSADGGIRDTIPDENIYYGINRQTYATYSSDGEVQMISARGGAMYAFGQCAVSIIFCIGFSVNSGNTWDAPLNNEDDENQPSKSYARVYDRTFGLADGLKSKSWSVQQPFDVIPTQNGQLALETPQTAQSTSLGLNPVSVAAPNTANPPPANPVTVTPPTATPPQATPPTTGSSQPTTPATPQATQATPTTPTTPQAATTTTTNPSPTISSPTVTAPPTSTTNTPTPTTNTPPSSNAQPIPLPAPVNTLPSTVSSAVNPTSTQSPNTTTPPPITNPSTVTAPNQVTPPVVGSSSAVSVSAPVGSVPVGNPISVKPPSSAVPSRSPVSSALNRPINAFGTYDPQTGKCVDADWGGEKCDTDKDLDKKADDLERQAREVASDAARERARLEASRIRAQLDVRKAVGNDRVADGYVGRIERSPLYQSLKDNPVGKTMFWLGVSEQLNGKDWNKYAGSPKQFVEMVVKTSETMVYTGRDSQGRMVFSPAPRQGGGSTQLSDVNSSTKPIPLDPRNPLTIVGYILIGGVALTPGLGSALLEGIFNDGWRALSSWLEDDDEYERPQKPRNPTLGKPPSSTAVPGSEMAEPLSDDEVKGLGLQPHSDEKLGKSKQDYWRGKDGKIYTCRKGAGGRTWCEPV